MGQRDHVVEVGIVLAPDVFQLTGIHRCAEGWAEGVLAPEETCTVGRDIGVGRVDIVIMVAGHATVGAGEVPGFQVQPGDFAAGQVETGSGLRQQARAAGGEDRGGGLHVAEFELGLGDFDLHRRAHGAVGVFGVAMPVGRQVAGAGVRVGGVKFQPAIGVGVNAEADGALGETRGVVEHRALGPVDVIGPSAFAIAIHVVVAQQPGDAAALDKPLGVRLVGDRFGKRHLTDTGTHRQC